MSKGTKILLILVYVLLAWYAFCLPRALFDRPRCTTMTASDGTLLGARISSDGQWCFAPGKTVPEKFGKCIICYEDKRFRLHGGIDPLAAGRALVQNLRKGAVVSGASTITMQVIRLSRPGRKRSLWEKCVEAVLATRLELRCSKKEILLLYASNAPFGGNVIGLEAAAWRYFGRDAQSLSWAENAMLAVLPNSPGLIHPGRNRDALLLKRNFLLDKLCASGVIDSTECELAKDEPLPEKPLAMPDNAHHLLDRAKVERGEGELRTTIDFDLQNRVDGIARSHFLANHTNLVDNMGILVVNVHSGAVEAYYGNTFGIVGGLRGTDVDMIPAPRSSGSTLKPLLYAAMLQDGSIYPSTLIKDTPYSHDNFSPHNYGHGFDGAVPAHEVIKRSLNVPSVRMLEQYGAESFLKLLRGMGFSTIWRDADHYGLSLILGGAEISLYTLARAYCRMAQKLAGEDICADLHYVADQNVKYLDAEDVPLSKAAIWFAFEALSEANRPEEEVSWRDFTSGRKIAWKTGTSWGNRDAWSVGVTAGHVVAVWVGNSDGEGRAQMTGVSYAAPVMFDVFAALPSGEWFEMPLEEMDRAVICRESGRPASTVCPHRDTVWVPETAQSPASCTYHHLVHLDAGRRFQVNSDCCPLSEMVTDTCFVLPPAQEWYYRRRHADYCPLPPKHPLFDASSSSANPVAVIYPQPGVTVVSTRGLDGKVKGAVFKAAHSDPSAVLYWHLDDEYLGSTAGEHSLMVAPVPGEHLLTVIDGSGACRTVRFFAE